MPSRVPAVRYTEARHSSMRTSLSSAGVSWRTLIGCPSYASNHACTLPSPSYFYYVMAKIVPVVQLAAHAKVAPSTVGRTVARPNFSAWWVTTISYNYGATLRALRALLWCFIRLWSTFYLLSSGLIVMKSLCSWNMWNISKLKVFFLGRWGGAHVNIKILGLTRNWNFDYEVSFWTNSL